MKDNVFRTLCVGLLALILAGTAYGALTLKRQTARQEQWFAEAASWRLADSRVRWEYQTLAVDPEPAVGRQGAAAMLPTSITPNAARLTELGAQGWEVVSSYVELETVWPNFGSESYVTGLQPNVRNRRLVLVLRRAARSAR